MAKGRYKQKRERAKDPRFNKTLSYFAPDGNFGNAEGYVIMETSWWDEIDWQIIKDCQPKYRPTVARMITESYEPDADEEMLREAFKRYGVKLEKYEALYEKKKAAEKE